MSCAGEHAAASWSKKMAPVDSGPVAKRTNWEAQAFRVFVPSPVFPVQALNKPFLETDSRPLSFCPASIRGVCVLASHTPALLPRLPDHLPAPTSAFVTFPGCCSLWYLALVCPSHLRFLGEVCSRKTTVIPPPHPLSF